MSSPAANDPPPATGWQRAAERAARPFALHTGTLRNVRDAPLATLRRVF